MPTVATRGRSGVAGCQGAGLGGGGTGHGRVAPRGRRVPRAVRGGTDLNGGAPRVVAQGADRACGAPGAPCGSVAGTTRTGGSPRGAGTQCAGASPFILDFFYTTISWHMGNDKLSILSAV